MRWNQLFADLEGRLAAEKSRAYEAEVAERTRAERADVALCDRLCGARGREVALSLRSGTRVHGLVIDSAAHWVLVHSEAFQHLVPTSAIGAVSGLGREARSLTEVERRLSLGSVVRELARARARVHVVTDARETVGVVGAVGADYLELSEEGVRGDVVLIPFGALIEVRATRR